MSVQKMCSGEPTLVPGALRGYRMWSITNEYGLSSTNFGRGDWQGDGTVTAGCHKGEDVYASIWGRRIAAPPSDPVRGAHGATPSVTCECGIYGWYRPDETRLHHGDLFGVVEASGRVLLGDFGFRAERARILALVIPTDTWLLSQLAEEWRAKGVAVFPDRDALLAEYPPDDVKELLGHDIPNEPLVNDTWGSISFQISASVAADFDKYVQRYMNAALLTPPQFVWGADPRRPVPVVRKKPKASKPEPVSDEPPSNPQERALWLRQRRNTGPEKPPLGRAS